VAIGNVLGSNMFNLLPVLGVAGVIGPFAVEPVALGRDFPIMAMLTLMLLFMSIGWRGPGRVTRWKGALLAACFAGYQVLLYHTRG
jgi:cation:H+ antiporter